MKSNNDEGISTIEAIVAIAIIAIAGTALLGGTSGAMSAMVKAKSTATIAVGLLKTDDLLRKKIGNIRIPYWSRSLELSVDSSSVEIPWYGGKPDDFLRLYEKEGSLFLETPGAESATIQKIAAGLDAVSLSLVTREDHSPVALEIRYTLKGKVYRTIAAFGSSPLEKAL